MKQLTEKEARKARIQLQYLAHLKSPEAKKMRQLITNQLMQQK